MKHACTLTVSLLYLHGTICIPEKALIHVPVADLVGESISSSCRQHAYTAIPLCSNNTSLCPRIHQAIFNEQVTILDETDTEYKVSIENVFYITEKDDTPRTIYWTLKKNCIPINRIPFKESVIPTPISYTGNTQKIPLQTVTLIEPWRDQRTNTVFSVGTRFIYVPEQSTASSYAVRYLDPKHRTPTVRLLPQNRCIVDDKPRTDAEKRITMINLIRTWIGTKKNMCIPYVWGGCSYTNQYHTPYIEKQKIQGTERYTVYTYPHVNTRTCHAGFDCAGVIVRAAQCVGIPFFYKNSYTMSQKLTPVEDYNRIEPGDIIWIPGHVMIIADLAQNTIIEARGYVHGYGTLQEIPIHEQFKNIHSMQDFMHAYHHKLPLHRIDKKGNHVSTIHTYKIVKLF